MVITHVADKDGFDFSIYPAIHKWFSRIQSYPKYVGMVISIKHQALSEIFFTC